MTRTGRTLSLIFYDNHSFPSSSRVPNTEHILLRFGGSKNKNSGHHTHNNTNTKPLKQSQIMTNAPIGIAILGAAGIAKKVFGAIEASGNQVLAIGCRDVARGRQFATECVANIPNARSNPTVCSYDEAIAFAGVQVVYIPLPVTCRAEWIEKSIAAGKHVVCEKPPAINAGVMRTWVEQLHNKNLLFIDGTMLSHGERIKKIREHIHEHKSIGEVRHVHADFTFLANDDDIRHDPKLEPIGALGDLGWYCVRFAQHLFGKPEVVLSASCQRNEKGGITDCFATLQFSGGIIQTFRVSFRTAVNMLFQVSGTTGVLSLDDFCLPCLDHGKGTQFTLQKNFLRQEGCALNHFRVAETVHVEGEDSTYQETQMWRNIASLVTNYSSEAATYWANLSVDTQETLDRIAEKL